jgi:hypothetical protein
LRSANQIVYQTLVYIKHAFVFAEVARVVALVQHTPDFGPQAQGVRQYLKHNVAVARAVAHAPQSCEAQGMRCVVGQVEAAFQRQCGFLRIAQSCSAGAQ